MLGYCILPLDIALTVCRLILITKQTAALFAVRFILVILGFAWSTFGKLRLCLYYVACVASFLSIFPARGSGPKILFSLWFWTRSPSVCIVIPF